VVAILPELRARGAKRVLDLVYCFRAFLGMPERRRYFF
jgi:hypothetical protein